MPVFTRDNIDIYYEIHGEGFPVLLFAPGGMRSALSFWESSPFNPITVLAPHFQVIAMDQRNAGSSSAPITASDGWHSYTSDHVALLNHLDVEQCHVLGGCIGGPYCFGLIQAEPARVAAAVIQQTIGLDNNQHAFYEMFDSWAANLRDVETADLERFRSNMYDGDFLLNVDEDFIRQCENPLLVLMGNDLYHPQSTSRRIAELAPNATLVESWQGGRDVIDQTVTAVVDFLKQHTPD